MTIQTNPAMFRADLPIYTVSNIDKAKDTVTLSGSDGSIQYAKLSGWGSTEDTQPLVNVSKVQLLPD